jgi:sn-glycerol 3-phosphate transport system permease protein
MGLNSTLMGIIIIELASSFACITMLQSFRSFPKALIDASRLDGSSELQTLIHIILPNMKSSLSSLGILLFINSWNDYLWPKLIARKLENSPIQIGLRSFISDDVNSWGSLMAATTISCIPILIIYLILQRNIIDSFMKWGIK